MAIGSLVACSGGTNDDPVAKDAGTDALQESGTVADGGPDTAVDSSGDAHSISDAALDVSNDAALDASGDAQDGSSDDGASLEGGAEAGPDSSVDASMDSGLDASGDSGVDAALDAGVESGADAPVESGSDASADAGGTMDGSADAGVDSSVGKPTCQGPWITSPVAPGGLSKLALTDDGVPHITTGTHLWSRSAGVWTSEALPATVGDLAVVAETGEIHFCGQVCAGAAPTPPPNWIGTPPTPFCRGVHVSGSVGTWSVTQLPALIDTYGTCGTTGQYYYAKWLDFPCAIDAKANGLVEIVQRTAITAPPVEACGLSILRFRRSGAWTKASGGGGQVKTSAKNDRVNVRLDSTGASHWNTCFYSAALYDTSNPSFQAWSGSLKVAPPGLGAVRLALDALERPTFAGASWAYGGSPPSEQDGLFWARPSTAQGTWLYEHIATTTRPAAAIDQASDSKPGIAYMQNGEPIVCWTDGGLHCATRSNGTWTTQVVSTDADDDGEAEVKVAKNGCCHIAYRDSSAKVRHATNCN